MNEDASLPEVVSAVQGTQQAFQSLLHKYEEAHSSNSRDHLALDAAMQELGTIVTVLGTIETGGVQIDFFRWFMCKCIDPTGGDSKPSIARALIEDMSNLEQRFINLNRELATNGTISSPPGEAMSIRRMVEKYHSIISQISSGQMMYVDMCLKGI
jgi:hypothetical protein